MPQLWPGACFFGQEESVAFAGIFHSNCNGRGRSQLQIHGKSVGNLYRATDASELPQVNIGWHDGRARLASLTQVELHS